MALTCGIVGLPMTGKTTLFNLLTGAGAETSSFYSGKTAANTGHAQVPDARVDWLSQLFKPKKTTYAQVEVIDIPGLVRGSSQGQGSGNEFLSAVRDADLLVQIVRAFDNDQVIHVEDGVDIVRDIDIIDTELLFADLQLIETRLGRICGGPRKKSEHPLEEPTLRKCQDFLMEEKPLRLMEFSEEELEATKHITFLTAKPVMVVVNTDEKQSAAGDYPGKAQVEAYCAEKGYEVLTVCARTEEEISSLPPDEQELFLSELGISESGVSRMAQAIYRQLGLISFLTAGEDEVRAWTIRKGLSARKAAGKIHTDIERGFIRAETVAFADLHNAGSMAAARDKGLFRLEGKEYPVADGDIINFRFNV